MSNDLSSWFNPSLFEEEPLARTKADLSDAGGGVVFFDDALRGDKLSLLRENAAVNIDWEITYAIRGSKEQVSREAWEAAPEERKLFRQGNARGPKPGKEMAPEFLNDVMFRRYLQSSGWRSLMSQIAGVQNVDTQGPRIHMMDSTSMIREHNDAGRDRVLAAVLYLSDGWRQAYNGQLCFSGLPGGSVEVDPVQNRLVLFRPSSKAMHYVAEITDPDWVRYSYVWWHGTA